jgi:hypothetical protein
MRPPLPQIVLVCLDSICFLKKKIFHPSTSGMSKLRLDVLSGEVCVSILVLGTLGLQ